MTTKTKVRVFKNNVEVGWFKDITPGSNALINACKVHGFDITEYHFTQFEDTKKIVWKGEKKMLEAVKSV
jgi:hypothetical protein